MITRSQGVNGFTALLIKEKGTQTNGTKKLHPDWRWVVLSVDNLLRLGKLPKKPEFDAVYILPRYRSSIHVDWVSRAVEKNPEMKNTPVRIIEHTHT